jgi:type IV pilus assembly protein PilW
MNMLRAKNRDTPTDGRKRQAGFTVVEILVALAAGLILAVGILQVFLSSKQTYQVGDQMSRLQENSRLAVDNLGRSIRMAGSVGCNSQMVSTIFNTLNDTTSLYYNLAEPLRGYEASGTNPGSSYKLTDEYPSPSGSTSKWSTKTSNLPTGISPALAGDVIEGSDILVIRGRIGTTGILSALTTADLTVQNLPANLSVGDLAIVADCAITRVFQVSDPPENGVLVHAANKGTPGNSCGPWNQPTGAYLCRNYAFPTVSSALGTNGAAEVSEVATTLFFISRRDYNSQTDSTPPPPSLYQRIGANPKVELVEGVENMQILYGVGDDAGNVQYKPASSIADSEWASSKIVSIRIGLLLRTLDKPAASTDLGSFDVNGTKIVPPDDKRLRKVFTTTIGIRSQLN